METIAQLTDKLCIVKLKLYHKKPDQKDEIIALEKQAEVLSNEIDAFLSGVIAGTIPAERLLAPQCKVYKQEGNEINITQSKSLSVLISALMEANYKMWNNQEKLYNFSEVPVDQKDEIVKRCCILNIERNKYMDEIDRFLHQLLNK
jgi:hypothetical protein